MATMLVVFVPQNCPATTGSHIKTWPKIDHVHACTMGELVTGATTAALVSAPPKPCAGDAEGSQPRAGLTFFSTIVLVVNCLSLAFFVCTETVLLRREVWLIKNLEEKPEKPAEDLPVVLSKHPKFSIELRRWNLRACHAAVLFLGLMVVNLGLSSMQVHAARARRPIRTAPGERTGALLSGIIPDAGALFPVRRHQHRHRAGE